jgi:hypothetical protein
MAVLSIPALAAIKVEDTGSGESTNWFKSKRHVVNFWYRRSISL